MTSHFCGRERENQPAVAGINMMKAQHVFEEGSICFRVFTVNNYVCAVDHSISSGSNEVASISGHHESLRPLRVPPVFLYDESFLTSHYRRGSRDYSQMAQRRTEFRPPA